MDVAVVPAESTAIADPTFTIGTPHEENALVLGHDSAEVRWSVAQLAMLVPETGLQGVRVDDWSWNLNGEWKQIAPSDNAVRLEFRI